MTSTDVQNSTKNNSKIISYSLLSTITENKEFNIRANIEGSNIARIYQGLLGWLDTINFRNYVNNNLLIKCNIAVSDTNRYDHIYWEETPIIQVKTRRNKPTVHSKTDKIPLPLPISDRHKNYTYTWTFFT